MSFAKPDCGGLPQIPAALDSLLTFVGFVGGGIGAGTGILWVTGIDGKTLIGLYWTELGLNVPVSVFLGGFAGAAIAGGWVVSSALQHLIEHDGLRRCYAGIVNEIVRGFSSAWDYLCPWTAEHDRFDVVLNHKFWDVPVLGGGRPYVWCANDNESPLIRSYQRNEQVIAAALGSIIGAGIGFVLGTVFFGPMAAGLLACLAFFPISFLCLLLAIIVAFLVAAASTVVGAFLGGNFGRLVVENRNAGLTPIPYPAAMEVGTFLTVKRGNMVQYDADKSAVVAYWAHDVALCGQCRRANPPFNYEDADQPDACPMSQPNAPATVDNH